jgi:hypothetical protein
MWWTTSPSLFRPFLRTFDMPYAKFDDRYPSHRKIRILSDAAFRVHTQAIIWCVKEASDGLVDQQDLATLAAPVRRFKQAAAELERIGLWESVNARQWRIHDYLDWQISAARWRSEQEAARVRQQRHRHRLTELGNGVHHAARNGVSHGTPDQTRPDQKEGVTAVTPLRGPNVPTPEPPTTCPKHQNDPDPPPSGAWKTARLAHNKWELAEADRKRSLPKCQQHPGQRADHCSLCRSEKLGAE